MTKRMSLIMYMMRFAAPLYLCIHNCLNLRQPLKKLNYKTDQFTREIA